jgi:hypothetical protein
MQWPPLSENYGQMGVEKPAGLNYISEFAGLSVKRVFAGFYSSIVLVEGDYRE